MCFGDESDADAIKEQDMANINIPRLVEILADLNLFVEAGTEYTATGNIKHERLLLSTIHASKGKEWKRVLVLLDDMDKFKKDGDKEKDKEKAAAKKHEEEEEESRILFVAFSRAQFELFCFEEYLPRKNPTDGMKQCCDVALPRYHLETGHTVCYKHLPPSTNDSGQTAASSLFIKCCVSGCTEFALYSNTGLSEYYCEDHRYFTPPVPSPPLSLSPTKRPIIACQNLPKFSKSTPNVARSQILTNYFKVEHVNI